MSSITAHMLQRVAKRDGKAEETVGGQSCHLQAVHDVVVDRQLPLKDIAEILLNLRQAAFQCSEATSHVTDFRCEVADCAVFDISKQVLHTLHTQMDRLGSASTLQMAHVSRESNMPGQLQR